METHTLVPIDRKDCSKDQDEILRTSVAIWDKVAQTLNRRRYTKGLFRKLELFEASNRRAEVDLPKPARPTPDAS